MVLSVSELLQQKILFRKHLDIHVPVVGETNYYSFIIISFLLYIFLDVLNPSLFCFVLFQVYGR